MSCMCRWTMAKRLLARAGQSCGLRCCACCGCPAQQATSAEVALAEVAPAGEEVLLRAPLPALGMRAPMPEKLGPEEPGKLTPDVHRYYSKHQLPSLALCGVRPHHDKVSEFLCGAPTFSK